MKRTIKTVLWLTLIAVISISATEEEEGRLERPFGRYGPNALQFDYRAAEELGTREFERNNQWTLEPRVFGYLSSAGKRMALLSNGMLPPPQAHEQSATVEDEGFLWKKVKSSDNTRVNNPKGETGGRTQSESSIAVKGNNIVISFNDLSDNISAYAFSTNGGKKFVQQRIPPFPGGSNLGDGVVTFGPDGEIYYSTLAFVRSTSIIAVAKSIDNGRTFSAPVDASTTAASPKDIQDKEWMAVDTTGSPFRGTVYVSWTHFTFINSSATASYINFSRSTNGGSTFEPPLILTPKDDTFIVQGSMPAVGPNGEVYVAYFDTHIDPAGISLVKSVDGGRTFSSPVIAARFSSIGPVTGGNSVRTNSNPSITVDRNNVLHIVYAAGPSGAGPDRSDILYVRSTDGGMSFGAPKKINDDETATTQFLPSIAAAADGTLGVKWWDRRNDPINDGLTDIYMAISKNGGESFGKNFRVTDHNWVFAPSEVSSYRGE